MNEFIKNGIPEELEIFFYQRYPSIFLWEKIPVTIAGLESPLYFTHRAKFLNYDLYCGSQLVADTAIASRMNIRKYPKRAYRRSKRTHISVGPPKGTVLPTVKTASKPRGNKNDK